MEDSKKFGCDLLVLAPHPDDAEISLGGTLALLADRGSTTWVVDLTRGELGTNATVAERWSETEKASAVLGLTGRAQLDLPDGFVDAVDREQVRAVASVLRSLRPRWVVTAPEPTRHPDHLETPNLVAKACFMARLASFQPGNLSVNLWGEGSPWPEQAETWHVEALMSVCPWGSNPSLFFDISETWERKASALSCYGSQFDSGPGRRPTPLNDPGFMPRIEQRAADWGRLADCPFAEALQTRSAPVLDQFPSQRWSG